MMTVENPRACSCSVDDEGTGMRTLRIARRPVLVVNLRGTRTGPFDYRLWTRLRSISRVCSSVE